MMWRGTRIQDLLTSGQGRWSHRPVFLRFSLVHRNDSLGQGLDSGDGLRVGQLAILELARLEVNPAGHQVSAKPSQHRPKLGVDREVVMVRRAHPNQPANLAHEAFHRDQVE